MRNKNSVGADDSVGPYGRKQEDTTMDLREITDFNAPELDIYARLTENQLVNRADPANALFIAESPLVIGRALDAGCVPVSFLMERKHVEGKAAELLARCPADIPVYAAPLEVLEQLTGFKLTRGMLCAMRRPKLPTVEQVCAGARRVAGAAGRKPRPSGRDRRRDEQRRRAHAPVLPPGHGAARCCRRGRLTSASTARDRACCYQSTNTG